MRLICIEAAASAAGVNERTIRRWITIGLLTRYGRLGPIRVLIDADELRELVRPKAIRKRRPETLIAEASMTPTSLDANG